MNKNVGHSIKNPFLVSRLDRFRIAKHRRNESLLGCFPSRKSLPALQVDFASQHRGEVTSNANKLYCISFMLQVYLIHKACCVTVAILEDKKPTKLRTCGCFNQHLHYFSERLQKKAMCELWTNKNNASMVWINTIDVIYVIITDHLVMQNVSFAGLLLKSHVLSIIRFLNKTKQRPLECLLHNAQFSAKTRYPSLLFRPIRLEICLLWAYARDLQGKTSCVREAFERD